MLVVEDEAIIRLSTVIILEDAGYRVFDAQNSIDALEQLSRHAQTGIMLTDVRMPGLMDGLSLVTRVRADYPAIGTIVMSAHSNAKDAHNAGARAFVLKPYMPKTLIRTVRDLFRAIGPAGSCA